MGNDPKSVVLAYIERCGSGKFDAVAPLLAPDVKFVGPGSTVTGDEAYLAVLRRLGPIWKGSEVKKVFVDGPDVAVIYDFVTDTPAGSVPLVEWLRIDSGRITAVNLFFDRVAFKPASDELARRVAHPIKPQ